MFTELDHRWMSRAIALAREGLWTTTPNPRVGCVIVKDNEIVGEGWHRRAGEAHAEVIALGEAGGQARGATVYVTLEPCAHHGRTPPCVRALVDARVGRVVAAMEDPDPRTGGRGLEALRAAGVDVRCGLLHQDALELNLGFVSRLARGRPWVRLKLAASLDGVTALSNGRSQWITSEDARADGHRWRARACALLTGIGTVRDDDPRLDVRAVPTTRQPLKVLVDSRLELEPHARIVGGAPLLVACAVSVPGRADALRDRGCEILELPNDAGKVDLPALLRALAQRGVNELHVEAGHRLNGSLVREDCVDEVLAYLAPSLLGAGRGMFDLGPFETLDERIALEFVEVERLGPEIRVLARRPGRLGELPRDSGVSQA